MMNMNGFMCRKLTNALTLDYDALKEEVNDINDIIESLDYEIEETPEDREDKLEQLSDMKKFMKVYLRYVNEILPFIEFTGESLSEFMRKYEIKYLCDKHIKEMSAR